MAGAFPCCISWQQLTAWTAHHGYGEDALAMLDTVVAAMDEVYLGIETKRIEKESKNRNPPNRAV